MPHLAFRTLTMWSHNSFTFILGTLVLFLVLLRLRTKSNLHLWEAAVFGLLTGFLLSIQLYFLTWVISIVIILVLFSYLQGESVKQLIKIFLVALSSSILAFFIFTLPILHRYLSLLAWIKALVTHQGKYGFGPEGIASIEGLLKRMQSASSRL